MTHRDDDWVTLAAVPATIGEFLDAVGHEPLQVDVGHSTLAVTRDGTGYAVECYGRGGGWYDSRRMSRGELVRYVDACDTVRLRRPESQQPDG